MFGLQNFKGSCWVNACLQAIFRIPEIQSRYTNDEHDPYEPVDHALHQIWKSSGSKGLKEFFQSIRSQTMPAGESIGDSHELLVYLCDQFKFLDDLCRFKIADSITCLTCKHQQIKEDSVIEYSLVSGGETTPISDCIMQTVTPYEVSNWICEKCNNKGCIKQQLIGSFPKVMVFHNVSEESSINYSSILALNKKQYALIAVCCFNGSHWWSYGRNMPPGSPWYTLDDTTITQHSGKQFPVSSNMRVLIYYRLEN